MSLFSTCRLDPAPWRDGGAARVDPSGAGPARASLRCRPCSPRHGGRRSSARPQERGAQSSRLARHLFTIATTAPAGKEVRVTGIGPPTGRRAAGCLGAWYGPVASAPGRHPRSGTCWPGRRLAPRTSAAIVFVASGLQAPPGPGAAGPRRRVATLGLHRRHRRRDRLPAWHLDGRRAPSRLARGLRRVPRRVGRSAGARPARERHPVRPRVVRLSRHRTTCAGRRVARCCRPALWWRSSARTAPARPRWSSCSRSSTSRRTGGFWSMVCDLARMPADQWRTRLAGAFQDFFRFELRARHTIGVGDVAAAGRRSGGAGRRRARRRRGRCRRSRCRPGSTPSSGRPGRGGVDVSFGQWQKLALARGFMRDRRRCCWCSTSRPPRSTPRRSTRCSSASPPARRAGASAAQDDGGITVLVSHRFSTVRMADLIVVLDGARVAEVGTPRASWSPPADATPSCTASRRPRIADRTGAAGSLPVPASLRRAYTLRRSIRSACARPGKRATIRMAKQ